MNPGIIICTRINSRRLPAKPLIKIEGITLIEHLLKRIKSVNVTTIIAAPEKDVGKFLFLNKKYNVFFYSGFEHSPLHRMAEASWKFSIDPIIRITHDKIFIDPNDIKRFLNVFMESKTDYAYSSSFVDGTGFEIISRETLCLAALRYKKPVEHISYAIKSVTQKIINIPIEIDASKKRLLIDYPEDIPVIEKIIKNCGVSCSKNAAIKYLETQTTQENLLPEVTIYTCAYNAEQWVRDAIQSVLVQEKFKTLFEYILIDDCSTDNTYKIMKEFSGRAKVIIIKNQVNLGIASASNVALMMARGKYIIRLDADDLFAANDIVVKMLSAIKESNCDALYPDHYLGNFRNICKGFISHHIGGTMFKTSAINHIKFTDGLRGYEGYDFFGRAKEQLKISYIDCPAFLYRQHDKSLSKTNIEERQELKEKIDTTLCENPIQ